MGKDAQVASYCDPLNSPFERDRANWGKAFDSGDSPIEMLRVTASSTVKSKNRTPDLGLDPLKLPGAKHSSKKRGRRKISLTICRIPVQPFDYIVKAGQPARPQTVTEDRYRRMEKS